MDDEKLTSLLAQADQLYADGRLSEALDDYRQALDASPDLAWAYSRIGAILAQRGDASGAEEALCIAIELDPKLPQAHSNLGNLYYARGDYANAVAKYKDASALSPATPLFHENLHAAYKKMGKLSDAVTELKQAHRLERESAKAEAKERLKGTRDGSKRRLGCFTLIVAAITLSALTVALI